MKSTRLEGACQTPAGLGNSTTSTNLACQSKVLTFTRQQGYFANSRSLQQEDGATISCMEQHLEEMWNEKENNATKAVTARSVGIQNQAASIENGATTATHSTIDSESTHQENTRMMPCRGDFDTPSRMELQGAQNPKVQMTVTSR